MEDHTTPTVWGPTVWRALHFIALGYPEQPTEEHSRSYHEFFVDVLPKIIPCKLCSDNYIRHLSELPITPYLYSGGKQRLFEWTVNLHNLVNKELGKADHTWSTERALSTLLEGSQSSTASPSADPGGASPSPVAYSSQQTVMFFSLYAVVFVIIAIALALLFMNCST